MFVASLISTSGFKASASDIHIQYTHTHEHEHEHDDHDHETNVASTKNDDNSHTEKHSHELVISAATLTFIESKNNLAFNFNLSTKSYPKTQNDKLPSSHCLHSIFRPPIEA